MTLSEVSMFRKVFVPFLILSIVFIWMGCATQDPYPQLTNSNATPEAKALYKFINEISGKYTLSGHHNYYRRPMMFNEQVKEIAGDYPVIWGSDFGFSFRGQDPDSVRQAMIDTAKQMYDKGYIITLMWHSCFPTECDSCQQKTIWLWQPGVSPETWDSLVTPGTKLNDQWIVQVDHVAGYLKQLRDANIPVLWRPYHEMNGTWFWWCNKQGEDGFPKLWRMMYDRFVNHHHLNNLIWVWNTNAPRDRLNDEAYAYDLFYPGGDYVDILAADVYHYDYKQSHHDDLKTLANGKPICLGEVGQLPAPEILDQQPDWTWFMEWSGFLLRANKPDSIKMLFDSPRVLTLGEVKRNSKGEYSVVTK